MPNIYWLSTFEKSEFLSFSTESIRTSDWFRGRFFFMRNFKSITTVPTRIRRDKPWGLFLLRIYGEFFVRHMSKNTMYLRDKSISRFWCFYIFLARKSAESKVFQVRKRRTRKCRMGEKVIQEVDRAIRRRISGLRKDGEQLRFELKRGAVWGASRVFINELGKQLVELAKYEVSRKRLGTLGKILCEKCPLTSNKEKMEWVRKVIAELAEMNYNQKSGYIVKGKEANVAHENRIGVYK